MTFKDVQSDLNLTILNLIINLNLTIFLVLFLCFLLLNQDPSVLVKGKLVQLDLDLTICARFPKKILLSQDLLLNRNTFRRVYIMGVFKKILLNRELLN